MDLAKNGLSPSSVPLHGLGGATHSVFLLHDLEGREVSLATCAVAVCPAHIQAHHLLMFALGVHLHHLHVRDQSLHASISGTDANKTSRVLSFAI